MIYRAAGEQKRNSCREGKAYEEIDRLLLEGLSAVIQSIRESDGVDIAMLAAFLVAAILVSTLGRGHNDPNGFQDQMPGN